MGEKSSIERGMLLMAAGALIIPGIDAIAKYLSDALSPGQIAACRFLFQLAFLLPIVILTRRPLVSTHIGLNALRGSLIGITTLLFFWALSYMPLADTIAIFFVEPLILTLIAALFMGEKVGWRRLSAIVVGFLGALLVIRPSFQSVGAPAFLPLGCACCFAVYLALTRRVAVVEDVLTMQLWAGIFGLLTLTIAVAIGAVVSVPVLDPSLPDASQWLLLAALGAIATLGHLLIVAGFRRAPSSILAPFQYLEILGATLLGFLIFDDFPDLATWIGILIIVTSGLYVFDRERRLAGGSVPSLARPRSLVTESRGLTEPEANRLYREEETIMTTPATPTVQIDNDRIRVTEWRFAKGAATGYHRHDYDYVVVPMTTGRLKIVGPDGSESFAELTAGQSYARDAGVEHDVINAHDGEFVFVEVEIKR